MGVGAWLAGGGARFARYGLVGRWAAVGLAAVGSAQAEIVDLGDANIIHFLNQKWLRTKNTYWAAPLQIASKTSK